MVALCVCVCEGGGGGGRRTNLVSILHRYHGPTNLVSKYLKDFGQIRAAMLVHSTGI